jgi:hypothetical protein
MLLIAYAVYLFETNCRFLEQSIDFINWSSQVVYLRINVKKILCF